MIVTIDGPSASGKGVTARALARKLNFYYLNTGLLYRAIGYLLVTKKNYTEEQLLQPREEDVNECVQLLHYTYSPQEQEKVYADGAELTMLKHGDVDRYASRAAAHLLVRRAVVAFEQELARDKNLVVDGRDSGSAVFPHAEHKFFLTASAEVRTRRWHNDQDKKGNGMSLEQARAAIEERDRRDSERVVAPLVIPEDAQVIDNSDMTIDETVAVILDEIKKGSN